MIVNILQTTNELMFYITFFAQAIISLIFVFFINQKKQKNMHLRIIVLIATLILLGFFINISVFKLIIMALNYTKIYDYAIFLANVILYIWLVILFIKYLRIIKIEDK